MSEDQPKRYWKSPQERDGDANLLRAAGNEFSEELPQPATQVGRRDFLKLAGLSAAVATASGCTRAPVQKAIPALVPVEEQVPGASLYYATTCSGCSAACGVLARVREGRPVKLEGNPQHPISRGGLCAVGQASLMGLYDSERLQQPRRQGKTSTWEEVDRELAAAFAGLRERGRVRLISSTVTSPTLRASIANFLAGFKNSAHVVYDPLSTSAILDAHARTHGVRVLPRYRFQQAEVIVSFAADFLGTWISPVEFSRAYTQGRNVTGDSPRMSYHVQFEPTMSLSGANADRRLAVAPSELGAVLAHVTARVANQAGVAYPQPRSEAGVAPAVVDDVAARLWNARGKSLVVSGSNDVVLQTTVNFLNHLLGNYGKTLDVELPSLQSQGDDAALAKLRDELQAGNVDALVVLGGNPAYELPGFSEAIARVPLLVSLSARDDETAALAKYVCPDCDAYETWGDAEPVHGFISVRQPLIRPLGGARAALETLAVWRGERRSAHNQVRDHWRAAVLPLQPERNFEQFWDRVVHDGGCEVARPPLAVKPFDAAVIRPPSPAARSAAGYELVLYAKASLRDGRHACNSLLQELPDPISKVAWDNYASLSANTASKLGLREGGTVQVQVGDGTAKHELLLPVVVQPGQHDAAVAIALGYGSRLSRRFANIGPQWLQAKATVGANGLVGQNVAPLLRFEAGTLRYERDDVRLVPGVLRYEIASTQEHNTLLEPALPGREPQARNIVRETTLAGLVNISAPEAKHEDLWPDDHKYTGHRWGVAIDLTACTGCSGCIVGCQVENNVPVVGKDEVRRNRAMHWLRVDRYYAETADGTDVAFHPMLCQQCENAPCETVCPVLATVHSSEGLNVQVYNRCVGTRYCANNCPYKGRRFNWFDYRHDDALANLALNPDVTVRSRGVMEKCTFCIQRIQEAKIAARARGEQVKDGDIQPACQQSCPADAIVFGDLNDPNSRVSRLRRRQHGYQLLEELNVRPAITYLSLVRNRDEAAGQEHHG